jgi:hypothetical protein
VSTGLAAGGDPTFRAIRAGVEGGGLGENIEGMNERAFEGELSRVPGVDGDGLVVELDEASAKGIAIVEVVVGFDGGEGVVIGLDGFGGPIERHFQKVFCFQLGFTLKGRRGESEGFLFLVNGEGLACDAGFIGKGEGGDNVFGGENMGSGQEEEREQGESFHDE